MLSVTITSPQYSHSKYVNWIPLPLGHGPCIVFVWCQYDGGNIEQRTISLGSLQNLRSQANDYGKRLHLILTKRCWSYDWLYNICNCAISFSCVLTSKKTSYPDPLYQFITITRAIIDTFDIFPIVTAFTNILRYFMISI